MYGYKKMTSNVLMIGAGGFKGFYYLGAIAELEKQHWLDNIHTIIGVSVGSILGLLYTVYPADELVSIASSTSFLTMFKLHASLADMVVHQSIIDTSDFVSELSRLLIVKIGFVPTLSQLYTITGIRFITVSTNMSKCEPVYLSSLTHPDMSCIEAVMKSASVPVIFKQLRDENQCVMADGVFSDPYPVHLFEQPMYQVDQCEVIALAIEKIPMDMSSCSAFNFNYIYQTMITPSDILSKFKKAQPTTYPVHLIQIKANIQDILIQNVSDATRMITQGMKFVSEWINEI